MRELGVILVHEHKSVTHDFVDNIWLRREERLGRMPHVLGRMEHPQRESVEELTLREEPPDWTNSPPSERVDVG